MLKSAIVFALVLLAPLVTAESTPYALPTLEDVKASCRTTAKAKVVLHSSGAASVKSESKCAAFAQSVDTLTEIVEDFIRQVHHAPKDGCTRVNIETMISQCASAMAKVYADTLVDIDFKGKGYACAEATSEGDAYAMAYAIVMANLWLGVSTGRSSAEAEAEVEVLNVALAKVWAEAKAQKCQFGTGSASDAEIAFAEQVRQVLTCVVVDLAVELCEVARVGEGEAKNACGTCGVGELTSLLKETESLVEIGVCSKTGTITEVVTDGAGAAHLEAVPCENNAKKCCDEFYKEATECLCGKRCQMHRNGKIWVNVIGGPPRCYCPGSF